MKQIRAVLMTGFATGLMASLTACSPSESPTSTEPRTPAAAATVADHPAHTETAPVNMPAAPEATPKDRASPPSGAPQDFADAPINRFEAVGYSPAWTAELQGNQLSFDVPETIGVDTPLRVITVTRSAYAKGANYDGMDGKTSVSLDLRGDRCDKTGENTEFTATLRYGKSTYHGCAKAL